MKFSTEEQRIIRISLIVARAGNYLDTFADNVVDTLINRFPSMPKLASPSVPQPKPIMPLPAAHDATGESNTKITPAPNEGYFVRARRHSPFNFYIVEYLLDLSQAELLCTQLEADDTARNLAIREAKNYDFYLKQETVKRPRQPREPKQPPVHFSFLD